MEKGNILDIGIAAVRKSSKINMFDRKGVQYWAFKLGFFELVNWLEENKNNYLVYLDSISFKDTPLLDDLEELINMEDENHARYSIIEQFEDQIKDYKDKKGFSQLKQLPMTYQDFCNEEKLDFKSFINFNVDDHAYNYFCMIKNTHIIWFKDGFYEKIKNQTDSYIELTGDRWAELSANEENNNGKFNTINESMRLATLFY